ncbi:hypothetical protein ACOTV8_09120 [Campylobacter jejuni]
MKTDVLNDLHEELKKAMKEGRNFNEFKNNLKELLTSKGWYGKKRNNKPKNRRKTHYKHQCKSLKKFIIPICKVLTQKQEQNNLALILIKLTGYINVHF